MNGCECELDDGNASMRRKGYDEYNVGMLKYGDEGGRVYGRNN